jgi:hypothetical protein
MRWNILAAVAWLALSLSGFPAEFRAGVARVEITPEGPYWMSGYAARKHPSEGVIQKLWAKALCLQDEDGRRFVIITTDLIGIPREVSDAVFANLKTQAHLARSQVLLSCSHTHCGPAVGRNLSVMFDFSAGDAARVRSYTDTLVSRLTSVALDAMRNPREAIVSFGRGETGFAANRRARASGNVVRIGVNTNGPVDHAVPVWKVTSVFGEPFAVLFAYACHNTTLGGDFYQINGDYSGFAQAALEARYPGATAMFMMLCGGDQNPNPRGTVDLARQHGESLAAAVSRVADGAMTPLRAPLRYSARTVDLTFAPHTRQDFEKETQSTDVFRQRRARKMLAAYDAGNPPTATEYPVQALRFGGGLTLLALGGEVVIDYNLRARREFGSLDLVVAGYCNDVMCYIPSRRVLLEGGYEPVDSMIYYGMPGPFAQTVEEEVFSGVYRVMKDVGARRD